MGDPSYNLNTRHVEREVKYDSNNGERMKNKSTNEHSNTKREEKTKKGNAP